MSILKAAALVTLNMNTVYFNLNIFVRYSDWSIVSSNFWTNFSSVGLTSEGLYILNSELRIKGQCWQIRDRLKERSAAPILAIQVSLLTSIVLGGHKGHLADGGRHCLFPDLDLDGCSIFGECRIHVTHGNVLFQARRGATAGHLTCTKHKGICLSKEILLYSFFQSFISIWQADRHCHVCNHAACEETLNNHLTDIWYDTTEIQTLRSYLF